MTRNAMNKKNVESIMFHAFLRIIEKYIHQEHYLKKCEACIKPIKKYIHKRRVHFPSWSSQNLKINFTQTSLK